jgi:hypothetical protein
MRNIASIAGTVLIASAAFAAAPDIFEKPLHRDVVNLPVDPANPQAKPKRTCSFYPGFMVKEVDLGEVGASELAIAPARARGCEAKTAQEHIVNPDDWSGYFAGVKGWFAFFDADDGHNGGMPFAVYSGKTGRKVFEDARKDDFRSIRLVGDGMVLRYRRLLDAHCSLYAGKGCWDKIKAETKLTDADKPECRGAYDAEKKRTPQFAKDIPGVPTIVSYDVETMLSGGKVTYSPQKSRVECWLED